MPYTAAQLNQYVTTVNQGVPPDAATQTLLSALAAQNQAGTLSDAQTLNSALRTPSTQSTTDVALATYEFFTGSIPSAAGLAFLVNNPSANANGLSSVYYQTFNQENRYYNFAINLGVNSASASSAQFAATYGGLTLAQTVQSAYEKIIGSSNPAAITDITSRISFFQQVARERAGTFNQDLATKAIIVGYILNEAVKADVGVYAQAIDAFNVSLSGATPFVTPAFGTDIVNAQNGNVVVNLTNGTDILRANVFNAGQVYTPGGDDRINSLQDEDVLTGTGTLPTLNFTFGNINDNGGQTITPVLNNIQVLNVAFTGSGSTGAVSAALLNPTLDLQDASGLGAINITRITDTNETVTIKNLASEPGSISIANTNSPATSVIVSTTDAALTGSADGTTVTLSNVNIKSFTQQSGVTVAAANGVEFMTLNSIGSTNTIGSLATVGLKELTITGATGVGTDLNLGTNNAQVLSSVGTAGSQSEAVHFSTFFTNQTGTLSKVDASAFTGKLSIDFGAEATGQSVALSGASVDLTFLGGTNNDTVRFLGGSAGDSIKDSYDGGAGVNTLVVYPTGGAFSLTAATDAAAATFKNFQNLEVRTGGDVGGGGDTVSIDMSVLADIKAELIRNEGQTTGAPFIATAETSTINLTKLNATQAANITVLHGTTGNSAIGQTILNVTPTDTANDTVGVTLATAQNDDVRNNLVINAGAGTLGAASNLVENVTINDADNESNTVALTNMGSHVGTLTLTGGVAGQFMNLDANNKGAGVDFYRFAEDGNALNDAVGVVDAGIGAAYRFVGATIDATASLDNVTVRVSDSILATGANTVTGAQTIKMGVGDDTVIFDALSTATTNKTTAGLTISDTVDGGAGKNTLVIDGDVSLIGNPVARHINIGASEWTNVKNFQTLRLVGDNGTATPTTRGGIASDMGLNAYNITLTNDFIAANSTVTAGVSRIAIVNDDDSANEGGGLNTAGTGTESGVTIDARVLSATNSFSYNGEEGASRTSDRFIFADANINGTAQINGGAYIATQGPAATVVFSGLGNNDVAEARNGSVVTIGDLNGITNVGTLEFANDTAINQSSTLQLDGSTVDALVNASHVAGTAANTNNDANSIERLTIHSIDNPTVVGATTSLNLDASQVGVNFGLDVLLGRGVNNIVASSGADVLTLLGDYQNTDYAGVRDGGVTNAAQDTRLLISSLADGVAMGGAGRAVTDNLNGGAGFDRLSVYGDANIVAATLTSIEQIVLHSTLTMSVAQYNALVAAQTANGNTTAPVIVFTGPGPHNLNLTGPGTADLSRVQVDQGPYTINGSGGAVLTNGPGFLVTETLTPASDSGSSNTDAISNVPNPTVRVPLTAANGGLTVGSTVTLYNDANSNGGLDGGEANNSATVTNTDVSNGYKDISVSGLGADGVKQLTAIVANAGAGTSYTSGRLAYTLDSTAPVLAAPTVGPDSGVTGDGRTNVNTLTVTGTTEANAVLAYRVDGVLQPGTITANGAGAYTFTTAALADGSHSVDVRGTDVAGNTGGFGASSSIVVDTTATAAPTVALQAATDSAGPNGTTSDGITNINPSLVRVTFTGTLADLNGGSVVLRDGGTPIGSVTLNAANIAAGFVDVATNFTAGTHSLNATVTDAAGNTSNNSATASVTLDQTAPAVGSGALTHDLTNDTGASQTDNVTTNGSPSFTYTGGENGASVVLFNDANTNGVVDAGEQFGGPQTVAGGSATFTGVALGAGTFSNLKFQATDVAGNKATAVSAPTVTVDQTNPASGSANLTHTGAVDTGYLSTDQVTNNTSSLSFAFTGGENGATAVLFNDANANGNVDAGEQLGTTQTVSGGNATFSGVALAANSYTNIKVQETDAAGNKSTATATGTVVVDTTAPTFSSGSVASGTTIYDADGLSNNTATGNFTFTLNFNEALGAFDTSKIHILDGNAGFGNVAGVSYNFVAGTSQVQVNIASAAGIDMHTLHVTMDAGVVTDVAGNALVSPVGIGAFNVVTDY